MTDRLPDVLDAIADGLASIANEIRATRPQDGPSATQAPSLDDLPFAEDWDPEDAADQGSEAVCPKHRKPYVDKGRGPFCATKTDDPEWANEKGWCRINPRNAAVWLRQHAR